MLGSSSSSSDSIPTNAHAQYTVGFSYLHGIGRVTNAVEAMKYFRLAANQGLTEAEFEYANGIRSGTGDLEMNFPLAFSYYQKAANKQHVGAQFQLGCAYKFGLGTPMDEANAFKYFELAAQQGCPNSLFQLAMMLETTSKVKAATYFKLAADKGHANAQYKLGVCYKNAIGVERNIAAAFKYFTLAANQYLSDAAFEVGECHLAGRGTVASFVEAEKHFLFAISQGHVGAQVSLDAARQVIRAMKNDEDNNKVDCNNNKRKSSSISQSSLVATAATTTPMTTAVAAATIIVPHIKDDSSGHDNDDEEDDDDSFFEDEEQHQPQQPQQQQHAKAIVGGEEEETSEISNSLESNKNNNNAIDAIDLSNHRDLLSGRMVIVERILGHTGPRTNLRRCQFLVKWRGFSEEESTWEFHCRLKRCLALQEYLSLHPELQPKRHTSRRRRTT